MQPSASGGQVVFDADVRFVTAGLRPAKRPKGVEIRAFLRRLIHAIRANWPQVAILVRADSHYACPEVLDWCEANGLDYIFGLSPTSTLKRHIAGLEASTAARFKADPSGGKVRRFKEFYDAADSWRRVRRIVARVEAGSEAPTHASSSPTSQRTFPLPGPLLPASRN